MRYPGVSVTLFPEREERSLKTELLTLGACSLLGKIKYV